MKTCADNPITAGLYGGLLLRDGQLDQALIWLEKSLLMDPEQSTVQADFAVALAAVGDLKASSDLATQVIQRSDVPVSVTGVLENLISNERWGQELQISAGIGAASNVEFVPQLESINLTFGDDGVAKIPLETASRPLKRGIFQQSLSWIALWESGNIKLTPALSVVERTAAGSTGADSQVFSGEVWVEDSHNGAVLGGGVINVDFADNYDREEWFVAARYRAATFSSGCQWWVGGRYQERSYSSSSAYDEEVRLVTSDLLCQAGWHVGFERSRNDARTDRVGGRRSGTLLSVARQVTAGPGRILLEASYTVERDAEAYSDFFARGEPRQIETVRAGATWKVPLGESLEIAPSLTHVKQSSNIELFNVTGSEFLFNMIYSF